MGNGRQFTRRSFLHTTAAFGLMAGMLRMAPAYAWQQLATQAAGSEEGAAVFDLSIRKQDLLIGNRSTSERAAASRTEVG